MDSAKKRLIRPYPKKINYPAQNFAANHRQQKENFSSYRSETDLTEKHEKSFRRGLFIKKILWLVPTIFFVLVASWIIFFFWKTYSVSKKISFDNSEQPTFAQYVQAVVSPLVSKSNRKPLKGKENGRINILLLGVAGKDKPGGNLTDTVMVASLNTETKKVALLSLPRDFYVPIPDSNSFAKINGIYKIGIENGEDINPIKETVEKILNIPINYYVVLNFDGFEKVIDDIGGINVTNERDIYDARYPGPNYSYETFELSKGFHKLDGATALKYVRERHDDPQSDFGRAKRQQQVIQAVKNKLFSVQTLFNVIALNDILNTLGDNIKTDITFDDIDSFIELSKKIDTQNMINVVLDAWKKDSLLKVSHIMSGSVRAFILVPRVGNYSEIQDLAENIFNQDEIKKRRDAIAGEEATIGIINKSGDSQLPYRIQTLLKDNLEMKNVDIIPNSSKDEIEKTILTDNTSGEKIYTLDELIKKLPASLDSNPGLAINSTNDDIIITLGSDLVETYKYEEDTVEDFQNYQNSDEYDNAENF